MKLSKWNEALAIVTHLDAEILSCQGRCHLALGVKEEAKACFLLSLEHDPTCFASFESLLKHQLLSKDELTSLLGSISASDPTGQLHQVYSIQTAKYYQEIGDVIYGNDTQSILVKAQKAFTRFAFKESLALLDTILAKDPYHPDALVIQISCLYYTKQSNQLFILAHDLVDLFPSDSVGWFATGQYYLVLEKYHEARRYFSKATMISPDFVLAWIGFAQSFAFENEHDQAVAAFSTACRVRPNYYLPRLFLGMEHIRVGHLDIAKQHLLFSQTHAPHDPLLLNELGIVYLQNVEFSSALECFESLLNSDVFVDLAHGFKEIVYCNAATCYMKTGENTKSVQLFQKSLHSVKTAPTAYTGLAILNYHLGNLPQAIQHLHEALSYNANDSFCNDLLKTCFEEFSDQPIESLLPMDQELLSPLVGIEMENDNELTESFVLPLSAKKVDGLISLSSVRSSPIITRTRLRRRQSNLDEEVPSDHEMDTSKRGLLSFQTPAAAEPGSSREYARTPSPQIWGSSRVSRVSFGEMQPSSPDDVTQDWVISSSFQSALARNGEEMAMDTDDSD